VTDHSLSSPGQLMSKLEAIDNDLAGKAHVVEDAAATNFKNKREWEKEWAETRARLRDEWRRAKIKFTVDELNDATLLAVVKSPFYKPFVTAEANYEAVRGVIRVLETRASIGQSLLRAMTKELS
jgi:hypothetical protein